MSDRVLWLTFGWIAQGVFMSRWIVQWWKSEKAKTSLVPIAFWWLSLTGALLLLIYNIGNRDWPQAGGQVTGAFVSMRNLALIRRTRELEMRLERSEQIAAGIPATAHPSFADADEEDARLEKVDS